MSWKPAFPRLTVLDWTRGYRGGALVDDSVAAAIVTIMVIPQSLAYALLAGLPIEVGLYAGMVPPILYALFGTSGALAVGPVAVVSLMTAATVGEFAQAGSAAYLDVALALALISGLMLALMGILRLGFLANFLSHPVISGFVTASGLLIAASQLKTLLGVGGGGHTLPEMLQSLARELPSTSLITLASGVATVAFLFWVRQGLRPLLMRLGLNARAADLGAKMGPVAAILVTTALSAQLDWASQGVKVVGSIPQGLPPLTAPSWNPQLWQQLLLPALLISIVGFVESVSVGQTLAARRRQRITPNQELVALGAANIGAAFTGGYPVSGGFSRSVVNFDAGARTPGAGLMTGVGLLLAALLLTPWLVALPLATLAATIVVAVLALVDLGTITRTWRFSRADFAALMTTLLATLLVGVEIGLVMGVVVSLLMYLARTSQPHIAEVGQVPGTEHFRNVLRHRVVTHPSVLSLRVDESLYFANVRALEDRVNEAVAERQALKHVVLQCSAINDVDASALESLEAIALRLREAGIELHLSEVKGPVMDRLQHTELISHLNGRVYLTHHQALQAITRSVAPD